jgi:transposase InsO family protein
VSYQLVEQLQKKAVSVTQACRVLQVSQSGYYAARMRSLRAPRICADNVHLKAAFAAYGSRRLSAALQQQGVALGRHRAHTLMRANGLRPVWKRKFVHATDSRHGLAVSPSVLARQFDQPLPNQAWVCDITYIRCRSSWLYLAAVLDLHSRKIVRWESVMRAEQHCCWHCFLARFLSGIARSALSQ